MADIILVDEHDVDIGTCEKLAGHQKGLLHRAFSIFIVYDNMVLLQKRHSGKYHSGGLWTNTCCSHPLPGETIMDAATRRLKEEMGIVCEELQEAGWFRYTANVGKDLIENELDHVLIGRVNSKKVDPDPQEIEEIDWVDVSLVPKDIAQHPEKYTAWFAQAYALFQFHWAFMEQDS